MLIPKPVHDRSYDRLHNAAQRYRYYIARISVDPIAAKKNTINYAEVSDANAIRAARTYIENFMTEYLDRSQQVNMQLSINDWMAYFPEPTFEEYRDMLNGQLIGCLDTDYIRQRHNEGLPI